MADPLSDLIALLRPSTVFAKGIGGRGQWAVRYSSFGDPSFCTVLQGRCRLTVDGADPVTLVAGDFVLLPATPGFTLSAMDAADAPDPVTIDLDSQTVTTPFQDRFTFDIDPFRKQCLLEGLDEIGLTLARDAAIAHHEAAREKSLPWLARTEEKAA